VANRFVAKLFGSAQPASAEVSEALAELAKLTKERPELAGPATFLLEILPRLYQNPNPETPPEISPEISCEHAAAKLAGGIPLLRGEGVAIDLKSFRKRWLDVCAGMERHKSGAAKRIADSLRRERLSANEMICELLAGRPESIYLQATKLDLEPDTVALVLRLALFPILTSLCNILAPLQKGVRWEQGYCPICGSWPLLGEFRGLEQLHFLRCALCAGEWEFPRLGCPFCGTRDHQLLGYLHVEGEESKSRAATCEHCRGYVKMLSTLTALSPAQLLAADLATMHLDLVAAARGYTNQL
jgi:FdhE protein